MHRSSETVAAIATALAKAQIDLTNPEKAMVGTVYNNRSDTPQSFRYASLSAGLDIVRKALGGQQIAIAQTTDIDRANGTVNLITLLLHTSGEWISSDWPVCQLSETAAPRRMGAALTYARRYALFTMVGIAGEDDLDAPPDAIADRVGGHQAVETEKARSHAPAAVRPNQRTGNPTTPPVGEMLSAVESAAASAQLIREIETLPEEMLHSRAIGILRAKNCLAADDAKRVEHAFASSMALPDPLQAVPPNEEPTATATNSEPQAPTLGKIKLRRERPRKVKALAKELVTPAPLPQSTTAGPLAASTNLQADTVPVKIQKSELTISEPRRHRDKGHLKFVASQPCLICGRCPADAHHLRFTQPRALGRKVSDEFTVPLCRAHHRDNHRVGDEQAWWVRTSIDPVEVSRKLWNSTRGIPQDDVNF